MGKEQKSTRQWARHVSGVLWPSWASMGFWYPRKGHMLSECCIDLLKWSVRRGVWSVVLGATLKRDLIVTGLNWKTNISAQNSLGSVSKISQEENVFCLRMSECVGDAIMLILVFQQRCNEESGGWTFYAFLWIPHSVVPFYFLIYSALTGASEYIS